MNQLSCSPLLSKIVFLEILPDRSLKSLSLLSWTPGLWSFCLPCSLLLGSWTPRFHGASRLCLTFTSLISSAFLVTINSSRSSLSWIPWSPVSVYSKTWIACALTYCSCSRYCVGLRPSWGPRHANVRFIPVPWRSFYLLLRDQEIYSRHPLQCSLCWSVL